MGVGVGVWGLGLGVGLGDTPENTTRVGPRTAFLSAKARLNEPGQAIGITVGGQDPLCTMNETL